MKRSWDFLIGGLLLYLAVMLPLNIAFEESINSARYIFELVIEILFIADVVLSFLTGFRDFNQGGAKI